LKFPILIFVTIY